MWLVDSVPFTRRVKSHHAVPWQGVHCFIVMSNKNSLNNGYSNTQPQKWDICYGTTKLTCHFRKGLLCSFTLILRNYCDVVVDCILLDQEHQNLWLPSKSKTRRCSSDILLCLTLCTCLVSFITCRHLRALLTDSKSSNDKYKSEATEVRARNKAKNTWII